MRKSEVASADLTLPICFRMFLGYSRDTIATEVETSLHCAEICGKRGRWSLGIPETTVLKLAESLSNDAENVLLRPIREAVCQGILPHLKAIVKSESSFQFVKKLNRMTKPDSQHDPDDYGIDPFGSDYFCLTCKRELSNSYFHCLGCESLLQKDFNVCKMCYNEKQWAVNKVLGSGSKPKVSTSDLMHTGI